MIYFRFICWKNLLSTGNTFTEIDLQQNKSTLIVGENGAGKSTILDALSFGLYGKPFRNINKNQLLNSINRKNLEVHVEFDVGKKQYKVIRGIKPNIFEVYCDGKLLDQSADQREYQEMFEKHILKLNNKSFNQIVVLGSASFVPFMQLTAANRREIIEDLLDINIFSKMNVLLKNKQQNNKTEILTTELTIKSNEEKIELQQKHIDSLKKNNDDLIEDKKKQIQASEQQIVYFQNKSNQIDVEIQSLNEQIKDKPKCETRLQKLVSMERKLEDKLASVKDDINFFTNHTHCPTCSQTIGETFKHSTIKEKNDFVKKVTEGLERLAEEIKGVEEKISSFEETESEIKQKQLLLTKANSQLLTHTQLKKMLEKEIVSLQTNTKQIDLNQDDLSKLQTTLQQNKELLEQLVNQRQLFEVAGLLLKDTGIKTKIIKQYVPIINKLINKYLAAMDFFVNFELNENFEETIKSRYRDDFSYESFSEGEKMRIDLALLFTWRAIAKLRNSMTTNLLIMDEVFDSSLDSSGTEEFSKILNNLTQDTNTFIISHKGDQLVDKFQNIVRFEKHKNFSRVAS